MIVDVHCHVGYSNMRFDTSIRHFSFESETTPGADGCESYFSRRMLARPGWFFIKRWLGIDPSLPPGIELDAQIAAANDRHWRAAKSADRLVLLAFDAYHTTKGQAAGAVHRKRDRGSDLYVSNSLVRSMCDAEPDRFLFGASIHPYRDGAIEMLVEVTSAGAALVKWLPVHQNIDATDERTIAFMRKAAELGIPLLIHYGGEMSLTRQHIDQEHPGPLIETLRALRRRDAMPTTIVAHVATPSFPWQNEDGYRMFLNALLGEFRDAPLYADISALAAFGRTGRLRELADRPELHSKLVWGTDFPIPVLMAPFRFRLEAAVRRRIAAEPSWIERDFQLKMALGFDDGVFHRGGELIARRSVAVDNRPPPADRDPS